MAYRIVFMGSPQFAVPTLRRLLEAQKSVEGSVEESVAEPLAELVAEVVAVVTQPDRPKGRGQVLAPPAVKVEAMRAGVPVLQPPRLKAPEVAAQIAAFEPDAVVVAAYGQILPPEVLRIPALGCLNVHASLLPKYRGAAPVNWAIIRGEMVTGVTIMQMDAGLDTGDILLQQATPIGEAETAEELTRRLAEAGAKLLIEALRRLREGTLFRMPQNAEAATLAPRLTKADGAIDWGRPAACVCNRVRGVQPWPGAYTFLRGKMLKLFGCRRAEGEATAPGEVLGVGAEGLVVSTGEGRVALAELQYEGGRRVSAASFGMGHPLPVGTILGTVGLKR